MIRQLAASAAVFSLAIFSVACRTQAPAASSPVQSTTPVAQATHPPALGGRGAAVATSATAQTTTSTLAAPTAQSGDQNVNLRLTFASGETHVLRSNTRMTFDLSFAPAGQSVPPLVIDMAVRYDVLDVAPDGSATVRGRFEQFDMRGGDGASGSSELAGVAVRMRLRPDGTYSDARVELDGHEVTGPGVSGDRLAETMIPITYPAAALHLGGVFQHDLRMALGQGLPEVMAPTRYTLAGVTTREGVEVARLESDAKLAIPAPAPRPGVTISDGTAAISGTDYAALATGWPVAGNQVMTMSYRMQGSDARMSGTMTARAETSYTLK